MGDLTRNFSRSEFACRGGNCCGGSGPVHPALVTGLQELRDKVGGPLTISSGFRCRRHNAAVGEAKDSQQYVGHGPPTCSCGGLDAGVAGRTGGEH